MTIAVTEPTATAEHPSGQVEQMPGVLRAVADLIAATRPPMPARVEVSFQQWAPCWSVYVTMPGNPPLPEVVERVTAWANALGLGEVAPFTHQHDDGHWFSGASAEAEVCGIRVRVWDAVTVNPPQGEDADAPSGPAAP